MLEKIKQAIDEVPNIPFSQYYVQYIMSVQDINIELEIASAFRYQSLGLSLLKDTSSALENSYKGLVEI